MGEGAVCVELTGVGMGKESTTSRTELKRDHQFLVDDNELELEPEPFPNKKQAKEALNEDIKSEVLNPVISPKENVSYCQDITSQPTELVTSNQVGPDEVAPTCSGNSSLSPMETLSHEGEPSIENNISQSDTSRDTASGSSESTSHVILEIPKHASSSGIRKITFKFSKRKEDYDTQAVTSVAEPVTNGIGQGLLSYNERHGRNYSAWVDLGKEMHEGRYFYAPNMELKMSKKLVPNNYPTNVKKLLSTGILDGARVKYISFSPEVSF